MPRSPQVQGVGVAAVQADAVPGVVPGREGSDAAPPGGQEGPSCVLDFHGGQSWDRPDVSPTSHFEVYWGVVPFYLPEIIHECTYLLHGSPL